MLSYIRGYYTIKVEGLGIERFINQLRSEGVCIYNVRRSKSTVIEFEIDRRDLKNLKDIYRDSSYDICIKQNTGIPFVAKRIYKHKALFVCALASLIILMGTSQFVTDVYIQTPEGIKQEELRKEFYKVGVKPGIYKNSIDRKKVRDYIMSKFDDVAYVSINVKGTNIFATVTKKAESLKSTDESNYCNIIAEKNGIIEKVIPRSGRAVVKAGDIVNKSDLLVTGANNRAIPEVWATTFYEAKKSANFMDIEKQRTGKKKKVNTYYLYDRNFTLRKKINFNEYIVENKEKKLKLGSYTFPLKIKTSTFYEARDIKVTKDVAELKKILSRQVLKELDYMIPPSSRIKDVKHSYKVLDNMLVYMVTVQTSENIAKLYPLKNGETERLIKEDQKPKEDGEEPVPSNPEKRPIGDIRNKYEDKKKDIDENKDGEQN
ncbi:MAG: sporulation protein YqfD [Clostridioides sp.]|jgi:similar to stage IV sporulation protein|nr:sporulation protein YqfD [Clostridioides sp.]